MKKNKAIWMVVILTIGLLVAVSGCKSSKSQKGEEQNKITSLDDLAGKKIGVQLGTTGDLYVTDSYGSDKKTRIERYNKGADGIQALLQGKIDCVIIDEQPAKEFIKQNPGLKFLEEDFALEDYAFCIAKENTDLLEKVDQALEELKDEGILDEITSAYLNSDEKASAYKSDNTDYENGVLTVATNAEFPPYEYYDNNQVTGIDIDIVRAISDELGMDIQVEDMAFDSIIAAITSGKVNVGASGFTVTEERKKNINFTDTYITTKQVIIVKGDNDTQKAGIGEKFYDNFIKDSRYMYIVKGLGNTLLITLLAVTIGIILGFIIAIIRTGYDRNGELPILNAICKVYLTVMRGTPVMIQLLIIYYVILASATNKIMVAAIAFGLNSAAYVAEIVRSGIMSVDIGQFEAGRSLGLNYQQTMQSIILPQAIKNILPALLNEVISLLKETSISGYIGLMDLTKGGDIIRSNTYEAFLPLIAVAIIYLALVMLLSFLAGKLERRLRNNER